MTVLRSGFQGLFEGFDTTGEIFLQEVAIALVEISFLDLHRGESGQGQGLVDNGPACIELLGLKQFSGVGQKDSELILGL